MEKKFEILEHTADAGVIAYGTDLGQAFANAAQGLFSLITDLDDVDEVLRRDIDLAAADREGLLVAWLNELIYIYLSLLVLFTIFHWILLCLPFFKSRQIYINLFITQI